MTEKDYSLLRPFDLEAAKAGAEIVALVDSGTEMESRAFVTGPDRMGYYVVSADEGVYRLGKAREYRMAPLCWVEGKPVYPDTPMEREDNGWPVAWSVDGNAWQDDGGNWSDEGGGFKIRWPRPKPVKRWINVYPGMYRGGGPCSTTVHSTEEAAKFDISNGGSIACVEIELPPLKS